MKKKIIALLSALLLVLVFAGCTSNKITYKLNDTNFKKLYYVGDSIDYSGLFVDVYKGKNIIETVPITNDMVTGFDTTKKGNQTLTVTYLDVVLKINIMVLEVTLSSVNIIADNFPLSYNQYDIVDYVLIKIQFLYSNGHSEFKEIDETMYTPIDTSEIGAHELTVTYGDEILELEIEVNPLPQETEASVFNFELLGNNSYSISAKYQAVLPENIVLPRNHSGLPVSKIAAQGFKGTDIKSIIIYKSVTEIGDSAFEECESLETVSSLSNISFLGEQAFYKCKKLSSIIVLSPSLDIVGERTFGQCSELKTVKISSGTTKIANGAFSGCIKLEDISIPSSMITMGAASFAGCEKLENITLPEGLTEIGMGAFEGCIKLKKATLPSGLTVVSVMLFYGCTELKEVAINGNITTISDMAFSGCNKLEKINLPSSLEFIGTAAFGDCVSLREIYVPRNSMLDDAVFYGWNNNQRIKFEAEESRGSQFAEGWKHDCAAQIIWNA